MTFFKFQKLKNYRKNIQKPKHYKSCKEAQTKKFRKLTIGRIEKYVCHF